MTDFRIRVVVDPSGATRGTRQVEGQLDRLGRSATRVQRLIAGAFAFTGLGVGLGATIRLLANFEQQMSTVRAITGATEVQFRALRTEAQRLGSTTRFSASEAAEGMQFLARAGFNTDQVLASINGTLLLAQAGALDLGSAADIASNILTGFRLNAAETGRVVDVLALASNSANTDVRQLGEAMKFVAPVAAGLGVSLEEAAAAIGALSDAGLQGSLAGTGLRRVLAELESPASKTRDILAAVGLTADEVRVSQVGLTTALTRLRDAGIDTGLALEIFGDRGGPAFEVLSNALPRVNELTGALENAGGTAERIAAIMDDNLNGALLSVRSALEGLILAIGDSGATGVFTTFFAVLAEGIRFLTVNIDVVIRAFEVLTVVIVTRFVVATLSASGAIGGLVRQMIALEFAMGATSTRAALFSAGLKTVQRAIFGVTAAIATNPFGLLAVAISAVIGFLYIFSDQISVTADDVVKLSDVFRATFEIILELIQPVLDFFREGFVAAFDFVGVKIEGFRDGFLAIGTAILNFYKTLLNTYIAIWVGAFNAIKATFDLLPAALKDAGAIAINGLIDVVEAGIKGIITAVGDLLEFIGRAAELVGLDNPFSGLLDGVVEGVDLSRFRQEVTGVASDVAGIAADEFTNAFGRDFIGEGVNAILDRARTIAEERAATDAATPGAPGVPTLTDDTVTPPGFGGGVPGAGSGSAAEQRAKLDLLRDVNTELENERRLIGLSNDQREVENRLLGIQQEFQRENIALSQDELAAIREKIVANQQLENTLNFVGEVTETVFGGIDDAIGNFIETGKFNFKEFASSIIADLARIATQAFLLKPLLEGLGSGFSGNGFSFDDGLDLGGIFSGILGIGGNQRGGSVVGGSGGPDSQLFVSKVSPGERIDFTPEGEGSNRRGGGTTINFNITTPDADSFRKSQTQLAATAARLIGQGKRNM